MVLRDKAPSSLDALSQMFVDEEIEDDGTLLGRLRAILKATERWRAPGLHTAVSFGMDGFKADFEDPWEKSKNQVGHFLTAVRMAFDDGFLSIPIYPLLLGGFGHRNRALRLIIGHEKRPDPEEPTSFDPRHILNAIRGFRAQYQAATDEDIEHFLAGRLQAIKIGDGQGNSLADLRLSYKGWQFGKLIASEKIPSNQAAADWIRAELGSG